MTIETIEQIYGASLPTDYLKVLQSSGEEGRACILHRSHRWHLMSERELFDEIDMKGVGRAKRWAVLKLLLTSCFGPPRDELLIDSPDGYLPLDRVFVGIAIGQDNTEYLYLDPLDNYSVWLFHGDGMCDVEKMAGSFGEFLVESKMEYETE